MMRENKRNLDRAIRELDRERMTLQNQEKKIILDIKKMAKEGQMVRTVRAAHSAARLSGQPRSGCVPALCTGPKPWPY